MSRDIRKYEFKAGLPQEIEVLSINALLDHHAGEIAMPHRAEFYHIFWFCEGTATHTIDFKPVTAGPGTLVFVRKGRVQMFDRISRYTGKIILFTDKFFNRHDQDNTLLSSSMLFNDLLDTPVVQLNAQNQQLVSLFRQIETENNNSGELYHYDIQHHLLHTLLLLCERECRIQGATVIKAGPDLDYVTSFRALLEQQYRELKTVKAYARQMHTSEKRLAQATHKVLGKTPKEVIDERVMLEAKRLLAHTPNSIKETGYLLGFEEPTNFIKYFRKHEGKTPIEFKAHY